MKELRELTKLNAADLVLDETEMSLGMTSSSGDEVKNSRVPGRIHKLLTKTAAANAKAQASGVQKKSKQLTLRFLLSPIKIIANSDENTGDAKFNIQAIRFQRNILTGDAGRQRAIAANGEDTQLEIPCGLVLSSIGYRSEPIAGTAFTHTFTHVYVQKLCFFFQFG